MKNDIPDGVWPTMLTPFTDENKVDYAGIERMIEWYIDNKVDGLFAVCQSSEMFYLSGEERRDITKFGKEKAGKRVPVISSGHVEDNLGDQIEDIKAMAQTGSDALVLVTNRLALKEESDEIWKSNLEKLLREIPQDIPLGFYECPFPYKRLISPELLKWCASTGRFLFLKDTCCDIERIKERLEAIKGSCLKIYNANSATLLESLKCGVAGFSGVMSNFHPDLYVWMVKNWDKEPEKAHKLQNFLGVSSMIEGKLYPVSAKYHMQLEGLNIKINSRAIDYMELNRLIRLHVKQLYDLTAIVRRDFF